MKNVPQGKEKSTEFVLNPVLEDEQFELDFDVDAYRKRFSVGRDSIGLSDRRKSSFFAKKIDLQSIVDSNLETSNDGKLFLVSLSLSLENQSFLRGNQNSSSSCAESRPLVSFVGRMQRRISRDFDSRFDRLFGRRSIHRFSNCFVQFSFGQFRVWLRRYDCRLRCGSSFRFESNEELVLFLVLFSFSGAHINPAVSIALLTLRAVTPLQCFSYIVSRKKSIGIQKTKGFFSFRFFSQEFIGAFVGAAIVFGCYFDAINKFDGGIRQVKIRDFSRQTKERVLL